MDDPDLPFVRALQAGQDNALNELMRRHKNVVLGFVRRFLPEIEDAEGIAQETFVRAYFKINHFRPRALFKTWLLQIAHNLCRDHLRHQRTAKAPPRIESSTGLDQIESPSPRNDPAKALEVQDQLDTLQRAIQQLPEDLKTPLILVALEGLSYREVAGVLRTTPKSVETKLYRARKRLSEEMRKKGF
jgi:RNA polymerase sigma factor CnrH